MTHTGSSRTVPLCPCSDCYRERGGRDFTQIVQFGSDARDALNRYAEHATAAIGATWSERDQLRNREERRSYACAFLAALIRDNPDLLPEYTAAVLADEIKRWVRR